MSHPIEDLTRDELIKVLSRTIAAKEQLANRLAALLNENADLIALYNETAAELNEARALLAVNGEQAPAPIPA